MSEQSISQLSFDEVVSTISRLGGTWMYVVVQDNATSRRIASFSGWYLQSVNHPEGVEFVFRGVGDPRDPTEDSRQMSFWLWREGFESAIKSEFRLIVGMEGMSVHVIWAFEDERPRDPFESLIEYRDRPIEYSGTAIDPGAEPEDASEFRVSLPELDLPEDVRLGLTFKVENVFASGEAIGPVCIWRDDDPSAPIVAALPWMSRTQARETAEHYGCVYYED